MKETKMKSTEEKRAALRAGLLADDPIVAIGSHDSYTARFAENYDFDVVWVSGFGVSTMVHGMPDLNLTTLTEAVDAARRMDAVTSLPVLADVDNGFGGYGNVVRTGLEYERAGIAGICIEDNLFPKRNSLLAGQTKRPLIEPAEQARRISAIKEAQTTDSFVVVARVEAFIAGHGLDSAIERAEAYADAGADAILIHSKDKSLSEIKSFLERWDGRVPLVAVPTLFPDYTVEQLGDMGISLVIWANHPMRAAVGAIEEIMSVLQTKRSAAAADEQIVSVEHIFNRVETREAIAREDAS